MPRTVKSTAMLLALAALAYSLAAGAQQTGRDWYRVEVIVFRHWSAPDTERFRPNPPPPQYQRLTVLRRDGSRAFRMLDAGELQLGGSASRLDASPDYELLEHFGWMQPALAEDQAISVALPLNWQPGALTFNAQMDPLGVPVITPPQQPDEASGDTQEAEPAAGGDAAEPREPSVFDTLPGRTQLFGTLTLFRGRYLHMDADLRYRLRRYQPSWTEREVSTGRPVYVLRQRRRMRSDELHYIDHPVLGLLVKVTPVETEKPDAPNGESGGAAAQE